MWAALIGTRPVVLKATAADAATAPKPKATPIPLVFGLWRPKVSGDTALFVLVIEASVLGSLVYVASSFAAHSAKRDLTVGYLWWYPKRFIVSTGLALLLYTALRGGLFSGEFTSTDVNPYGVAAIAGLAGMFSKQATAKLAQLFDVAFAIQAGKGTPQIDAFDPKQLKAGAAATPVKVTGRNFVSGATATVDDSKLSVSNVKDTELTITVPKARLEAPAPSKIRVDNPDPTVGASAPADLPVSSTPSTKPRPKIDALEPNTLPAQGEDAPVKVTGSNFAGDATVTAYETKLTPTGVKTTELTITLPKDLLATPGNVNIRVVNPDSDGAASDPAELPVVVREAT